MSDQYDPHCQHCGAQPGEEDPYAPGRPILITIGSEPLDDTGLRHYPTIVCSVCSDGARHLNLDRPSAEELLVQVRRASAKDQVEVLDWLRTKFAHY